MAAPPASTFGPESSQYSTEFGPSQMEFMSSESGAAAESTSTGETNFVPRPKRIACVVCRRRKLRCDGRRPSCGTCSRLGHECSYDEVRKKSGPKRGYVKQLEARLAQVETLLKVQDPEPTQRTSQPQPLENAFTAPIADESILDLPDLSDLGGLAGIGGNMDNSFSASIAPGAGQPSQILYPPPPITQGDNSQWDLISLGLEEPLPPQDVIDELDALFFEKIYPMMPIIHRPRYYAALNLAPNMRPPICLRYIMWCNAASVSDKYFFLHSHFYQRARKYAEADEMKGFGENIVSLAHCQTWLFIGTYEFRMIFFPRAWLSVGKAARLALMLGLNRLDGVGLDVKQSILPPKDWTEREERRRVFWGAFATDRYSSVGTGWPILIDENDIMTNLPASEDSFTKSKPQRTLPLNDIIAGEGVSTLAPFACVVVLASLFGRNLIHIHRPQPQDNDHDLNGDFWKRHRSHDNILLHISLSLPDHLRLPSGVSDVNVIFANMSIHTSTICLHQAAIFKAEKNKMPNQITTESKRRCLVAANQISSTMKMISHVDLTSLNPFMSFCLYIAARVFVQYLKSRPDDSSVYSSLQFLVSALTAMKNKNPLTESFLVQLDVDLDGTGIRALDDRQRTNMSAAHSMVQSYCNDKVECTPIYNLRQTQGMAKEVPPQYSTNRGGNQPMPAGLTTSLPSRNRDSTTQPTAGPVFNGDDTSHFFGTSTQATDQAGPPGAIIDTDMDFRSDFGNLSDRNNPPSDHPTPSTLNSSSNTSYSINGADDPPPGNKNRKTNSGYPSQESAQSFDKVNSDIMPQGNTNPRATDLDSMSGRFYPNSSNSPSVAGASGIFSMPSAWDLPPSNPETGNEGFGNLNMEAFSESQWAQILNGQIQGESPINAGWENWRPS
ncbi:transcriptional regulator family: Fungal Specific TF [Penicillium roqueforti]|nr:transcriptional regulator family: Fungal Specific TF [Penicillium roqueforti]KAI2684497.1 transcriptional regulator family: Fungal Specific TF [Penicillium roqueforti]KAI2701047.1 transcriptional regulator family: Fungal Specific TF [Penicillium roqueforti]KAI2727371.1 transcriptional regulator family: Fungal Specific TF [Penicillium roqueforti]KAI2739049.1 transcriptional regulator family: Fungal Specific TF [Penicillium roqueforti]